jgi:ABC-type multidrug transport system ATPase subunit
MNSNDRGDYPLIVEKLTKIYPSALTKGKKSLDNLTLSLNYNEIFGLLGPNGAGKTTFFSLLTGIYEPTKGDALVSGYSILTDINKVQELIGYCPQFDILWDELSIEEHLSFYSQLKNSERKELAHTIEQTIKSVKLDNHKHLLVKELSGGMKRRLSLGIALVGNPSIIFLDEPTTGLDPQNKRQIWNILSNNKDGKCMILTTHLMDEAEVLSDRIGIIVNGKLKCLGTQFKLKKVHGKGFKLSLHMIPYANIDMNNDNTTTTLNEDEFIAKRKDDVETCIHNVFPNAVLIENYKNIMVFEISNEEFNAEVCFNTIEAAKKEMFISNWSVSQVSLEDIFIKLTENDL